MKEQGKFNYLLSDIQSPLNVAGNIIDINSFIMDFILDPDPNDPEPFASGFSHTGIVLNARIVGNLETRIEAYDMIHEICQV
jgi:hypothetical protein